VTKSIRLRFVRLAPNLEGVVVARHERHLVQRISERKQDNLVIAAAVEIAERQVGAQQVGRFELRPVRGGIGHVVGDVVKSHVKHGVTAARAEAALASTAAMIPELQRRIAIKETLFRFVSRVGHELSSTAVQSDAWHHRADASTSAAAFIGISIALIGGKGYERADDWAAPS